MGLEDISTQTLTAARRALAGAAIAAVAVFGVAACEDTETDEPDVQTPEVDPGMEGEEGMEDEE